MKTISTVVGILAVCLAGVSQCLAAPVVSPAKTKPKPNQMYINEDGAFLLKPKESDVSPDSDNSKHIFAIYNWPDGFGYSGTLIYEKAERIKDGDVTHHGWVYRSEQKNFFLLLSNFVLQNHQKENVAPLYFSFADKKNEYTRWLTESGTKLVKKVKPKGTVPVLIPNDSDTKFSADASTTKTPKSVTYTHSEGAFVLSATGNTGSGKALIYAKSGAKSTGYNIDLDYVKDAKLKQDNENDVDGWVYRMKGANKNFWIFFAVGNGKTDSDDGYPMWYSITSESEGFFRWKDATRKPNAK